MSNPEILALGEALVEFVRLPDRFDGRPLYRQGYGGDTSNAIIAAARQGARTGYITAVGGDPFGRELVEFWEGENVDTSSVIVRADDPTGVCFVRPDPVGRDYSYARRGSAASLYGPEDLPEAAIARARILHVSAISQAISATMRAAVRRAAEIARANGTLVSYDTNLRLNLWTLEDARRTVRDFMPLADIVLPSDDEAKTLLQCADPEAIVTTFAAGGAGIVLLKRGVRGLLLAVGGERFNVPAAPAKAVDSTGAGDSCAGAFLAHYLESGDPVEAARRAAAVAACTVSGYGAVDSIPRRNARDRHANPGSAKPEDLTAQTSH